MILNMNVNADELFSNISDASNKAIKIFILDVCRENIFDNSNFKNHISLSMNNIWNNNNRFSTLRVKNLEMGM